EDIIGQCVSYKAQIVSRDEYEQGLRMILNFGHTIGHAVERLSGYRIRHGQGIAVGMSIITRAAEKKGICESGTSQKLEAALKAFNLPTSSCYSAEQLADAALYDKKRRGDKITLVLPIKVGNCLSKDIYIQDLGEWIELGMGDRLCR
ncbi:MAG: 3-dehydroquinate synthase, partial [Eubacteriales bacterium]|nr:3-dehydroquinate synthase [Eubacteriales bacterium]